MCRVEHTWADPKVKEGNVNGKYSQLQKLLRVDGYCHISIGTLMWENLSTPKAIGYKGF